MSTHGARIVWQAVGDFAAGTYSRAHTWQFDGGAVVAASSSPAVVPLPFSDPAAVDPEEAFIAALSSCHMLWFLDHARRAELVVQRYDDRATGTMARQDGRLMITRVTLRPKVEWAVPPDIATEQTLHHKAHEDCFIANSVKTEVVVDMEQGNNDDRTGN